MVQIQCPPMSPTSRVLFLVAPPSISSLTYSTESFTLASTMLSTGSAYLLFVAVFFFGLILFFIDLNISKRDVLLLILHQPLLPFSPAGPHRAAGQAHSFIPSPDASLLLWFCSRLVSPILKPLKLLKHMDKATLGASTLRCLFFSPSLPPSLQLAPFQQ